MKRFTEYHKGVLGIKTKSGTKSAFEISTSQNTMQTIGDFQDGIDMFAKYEDLELSPQQIKEVDKLYLEKCEEVNQLKADVENLANINNNLVKTNFKLGKDIEKLKATNLTADEMHIACVLLKHYKELHEQGLLIELPCKKGDTLYDIFDFIENRNTPEITEYKVDEITIKNDRKGLCFIIDSTEFRSEDFGKNVFTSREEAEKKLAESVGK